MSRKSPRFVPGECLVEITARVVGGRFLLAPCEELNAAILATLGRALNLYPVALHAMAFMSNHWHGLVSVPDAAALAGFMQHVHSNIARAVQRLRGWDGSVFGKASLIVVAAGAEEDRLRYVLAQGVKEGLVRRCVEWPGVHAARTLLLMEQLVGRWQERRRARRIARGGGKGGGRAPLRAELETVYPIDVAPLPSWRHLDAASRRLRVTRLVNDIEANARAKFPSVLGVDAVCAADPFFKLPRSKRGAAPPVHAATEDERITYTECELAFDASYVLARQRLRSAQLAELPPGCFSPTPPFQPWSVAIWIHKHEPT